MNATERDLRVALQWARGHSAAARAILAQAADAFEFRAEADPMVSFLAAKADERAELSVFLSAFRDQRQITIALSGPADDVDFSCHWIGNVPARAFGPVAVPEPEGAA
jgi:hypothetical protein